MGVRLLTPSGDAGSLMAAQKPWIEVGEHAVSRVVSRAKSLVAWSLAAVLVGGLALIVGMFVRQGRGIVTSVPLPGGAIMRCVDVTYGTNHFAIDGSPLLLHLPGRLTRVLTRLFPSLGSAQRWTTSEPRLILWYHIDSPSTGSAVPFPGGPGEVLCIADDRDREAGDLVRPMVLPTPTVQHVEFSSFPTRCRTVALRLYASPDAGRSWRLFGTFELRNPAFHTEPPLIAEALPASKSNGRVMATLHGLRGGFGSSSFSKALPGGRTIQGSYLRRPGEEPHGWLSILLEDRVNPTNQWQVSKLRFTDGVGNTFTSQGMSSMDRAEGVSFQPTPWPDEVWRMTVRARRTAQSHFEPEECASFGRLDVPPAQTSTNFFTNTITLEGVTVAAVELRRMPPRTDTRSWSSANLSALSLRLQDLRTDQDFSVLEVKDDQRRVVPVLMTSWSSATTAGPTINAEASIGFDLPDDVRWVTASFAIQTLVSFEFRVRPDYATTNNTPREFFPPE